MSDIITVEDLNLWYGSTQALHHVSMEIPEKSIAKMWFRIFLINGNESASVVNSTIFSLHPQSVKRLNTIVY